MHAARHQVTQHSQVMGGPGPHQAGNQKNQRQTVLPRIRDSEMLVGSKLVMDEIIRWKPFLATYISYCGRYHVTVSFRCPHCGGRNCDRRTKHTFNRVSDRHFFQGGFRCSDCGAEHDKNGESFYYASECFPHIREEIVEQLSLFE